MSDFTATADVDISASPDQVWHALTEPDAISRYFFGTAVETTWEPGSPITWRGEFDGKRYEDVGEVLTVVPPQRLEVTHRSGAAPAADEHRISWEVEDCGDHTHVHLEQDNNADRAATDQSQQQWEAVLAGLKEFVERG
jgi:uncharacterized protein YndB with AHSA1/START domain